MEKTIIFNHKQYLITPCSNLKKGELAIQFNDINTKPMDLFIWESDNPPPFECVIYKVIKEL